MYDYEESVYPGDYINPWFETEAYLMSDPEEDAPSSSEPAAPEESTSGPEPSAPEESSGGSEPSAPEESASDPGPSAPEPEEETGVSVEETAEPVAPPAEAPEETNASDTMQDLIDAIGGLNETITGVTTQEPEEPPAEREQETPAESLEYEYFTAEPADVDLEPVIQVLERQEEVLLTLHNDLYQLQANVDLVFLAVAALIGVVLGVAVGRLFHDLWRA